LKSKVMQMATEHDNNPQDALSALADGQLRGQAFAQAVEWVTRAPDAQSTWHAYHVVGDALRSEDLASSADDLAFLARFQSRLAQEPALVPAVNAANMIAIAAYSESAKAIFEDEEDDALDAAANAPRFGWKRIAGLASVLAVAVVGWNVVGGWGMAPAAAPLAQLASRDAGSVPSVSSSMVLASGEPRVMLRDARLDALLAAHKQFGGASALQVPAGFLRNATFESAAP
jgi:sigma-E factor negative regulatory protein RseA